MNEEYKQIGSKHINSFGNASQFWGYYYYKMYRVGTKMFYRLKARLTYVNTTGAEGYYQDQAVAQFRINTGGEPNYNSTKVIKPTTYGYFYNGQYWEVESDWFSFDKVEGKTKCEINLNNSVTYGFDSPNYSFELDIVTALSTLTVNNGTSFAVDTNENKSNTIPVLLTQYDDSYTHKLKITMENSQNTKTVIRDYTTFTGNTLTFSSTELTKIYSNTNSQNISLIFDLDTYSGSNKIGTSTLKMSAYLSTTDLYPTFTTTFLETNDKVVKLLGSGASTLVQNASKLKTTVVPKGHKSATIKNVQFLHNQLMTSKTTSPYEYTFNVANSIFTIAVTDSRDLTTSTEYKKNIIEYIPVKINNLRFKRQNMTGSNVLLSAQISYKQATFGSTKNTPTIKWKKGASGTFKTLTSSNYTIDSANNLIKIENLLLSNVIDYQATDDFYLTVSDLLSEDEDVDTVLKGVPTYEAGEHDFQVNGTLYVADINRQNQQKVVLENRYSVSLSSVGWYRVAVLDNGYYGGRGGNFLVGINSYWYNNVNMSILNAISIAYERVTIKELVKNIYGRVFDKIRTVIDKNSRKIFLDLHYNVSNSNQVEFWCLNLSSYFNAPEVAFEKVQDTYTSDEAVVTEFEITY